MTTFFFFLGLGLGMWLRGTRFANFAFDWFKQQKDKAQ